MQSGWFYLGGVIFLIIQFDRSSQLLNEIRRLLIKAHENQFLATSINEIYSILKITNEDKYGFSTVYGGGIRNSGGDIIRNFEDDLDNGICFKKNDNSWFDFFITTQKISKGLYIDSYSFSIRYEPKNDLTGKTIFSFIRYDLNQPGHTNEERNIRSHIHPNSNILQFPYPEQSPLEILDMLLFGVRNEIDNRKK